MRLVQHRADPAKWIQHFKEQAMGVRHPTRDGYIFIGNQMGKGSSKPAPVKLVSPVQQVIEQAKAEIKREGKGIKRKRSPPKIQSKKKPSSGKTTASRPRKKYKTKGHSKPKKSKSVTKKKNPDIFSN